MEEPIRLSVDEIAAICRLSAIPTPAYLPATEDLPDAAVEAGIRGLVTRNLLTVSENRTRVSAPQFVVDLVALAAQADDIVVITVRAPDGGRTDARVLVASDDVLIIEERIYDGVMGYTPIRRGDELQFLTAVSRVPESVPDPHESTTVDLAAGSEWPPANCPSDWSDPTLVVTAGTPGDRGIAWVAEGSRLWALDTSATTESTMRFRQTGSAEILAGLQRLIDR